MVTRRKKQEIDITTGSLQKILGRMPNWKSPGPDLVLVFWFNSFNSLHEMVRLQLKECLDNGFVRMGYDNGFEEGLHCYRKLRVKVI